MGEWIFMLLLWSVIGFLVGLVIGNVSYKVYVKRQDSKVVEGKVVFPALCYARDTLLQVLDYFNSQDIRYLFVNVLPDVSLVSDRRAVYILLDYGPERYLMDFEVYCCVSGAWMRVDMCHPMTSGVARYFDDDLSDFLGKVV